MVRVSASLKINYKIMIYSFMGVVLTLIIVNCFASENKSKGKHSLANLIKLEFNNELLSVNATNIFQVDLLRQIGSKAGFEVITVGEISSPVNSWEFSKLSVDEAIDKILKGTNVIISYDQKLDPKNIPKVSRIFILGVLANQRNTVHVNIVEPNRHSQVLLDSILLDDSEKRLDFIDRLEGRTDELTLSSLAFSLQHDPDPKVRRQVVTILGRIGGEDAVSILEHGLADQNSSIREKVVQVLGNTQDERTTSWLGQIIMGDENADVRLQAVLAIAGKIDNNVRIFLEAASADSSSRVSEAAKSLLKKINNL